MAIRKVTQIYCDRCQKSVEGEEGAEGRAPVVKLSTSGSLRGAEGIVMVDLCTKCVSRVETLLGQIRLDEPPKGGDDKADVGDAADPASNKKPTVTEN